VIDERVTETGSGLSQHEDVAGLVLSRMFVHIAEGIGAFNEDDKSVMRQSSGCHHPVVDFV